jgi:hypothetical protein
LCEFGSKQHRTAASWLSSSAVSCTTPAHMPGDVAVRVSLNGQQFAGDNTTAMFLFQTSATVNFLSPIKGSSHGGTVVALSGSFFVKSTSLACRFGRAVVPATFVSANRVTCVAPAQAAAGTVGVEVTNNGADYTSDGKVFTFVPPVRVTSITPISGPSAGGTLLTVSGAGFDGGNHPLCRFGGVLSSAVSYNATAMVCKSPPHQVGLVAVEFATNDVDFTNFGMRFSYYPAVGIAAL